MTSRLPKELQVKGRWTDAERRIVQQHYPTTARDALREMLPGRTYMAMHHMARKLGVRRHPNHWRLRKRSVRPTIKDIAWAAGIYEGEGSTPRNKSGVVAFVTQKDAWLPHRLQELFGGSVAQYESHSSLGQSPMWRWSACGSRARGFLLTIYPLLSPKRRAQISEAFKRTCRRVI